ncbi:MAG: flippase [Saprospiraceae bacterium]|nr:flippase [Saprospiraceae bacterium]
MTIRPKIRRWLGHELVRGSGLTLGIRLAGIALSYAFSLAVTNWLGPEAFGDYTFFVLMINVLAIFSALGFDGLVVRHIAACAARNELAGIAVFHRSAIRAQVMTATGLAILLLLLHQTGWFSSWTNGVWVFGVTLAILPQTLLKYFSQAFKALRKIRWYALFNYVATPLFALIILLGIQAGGNPKAPVWAQTAALWIALIAAVYVWYRTFHGAASKEETAPERPISMTGFVRQSWPFLLTTSVMFFNHWADQIVLKTLRGSYDLGIYAAGNRIVNLVTIPLMAVNSIAAPKLARAWAQADHNELRKSAQQATRLIFWTSAPVLLCVVVLAGPLLRLFGPQFSEGVLAMQILALGQCCNVMVGPTGAVLNMTRYDRLMNKLALASLSVNIVVSLLFTPTWGAAGAAMGSAAGLAVLNGSAWFFIRQKLGFSTIRI